MSKKHGLCLVQFLLPLQLELPVKQKILYKHPSVKYATIHIKEHLTAVHILDVGNSIKIDRKLSDKQVALKFKYKPLDISNPELIFATQKHKQMGEIPAMIYYRSLSDNRENEYMQDYFTQLEIIWEIKNIDELPSDAVSFARRIMNDFLALYKYCIEDTRTCSIDNAVFGIGKVAVGKYSCEDEKHSFPNRLIKNNVSFHELSIKSINHNTVPFSAPRNKISITKTKFLINAAVTGEQIPYYCEVFLKGLENILAMDYRAAIIDFNMSFEICIDIILRACYLLLKVENIELLFERKNHFGIKNQMKHLEKCMQKLKIFNDTNKFYLSKYWDLWLESYELRNQIIHHGRIDISKKNTHNVAFNIKQAINFLIDQKNKLNSNMKRIELDLEAILEPEQIEPGSFRILFTKGTMTKQ